VHGRLLLTRRVQILYLSSIYTRGELALRIGLFYTAASLSGAFGGLLARGLSEIGTRGNLSSWRWIFVIEGLLVFYSLVLESRRFWRGMIC
jgi:hypothetical protein